VFYLSPVGKFVLQMKHKYFTFALINYKHTSIKTKCNMSELKEYVSLRIPADLRQEMEDLVIQFAKREDKRVTLAHVLRESLQRGRVVLQQELMEPVIPGVSFVTQPTRLHHLSAITQKALALGFAQIHASSSSQSI